MNKTELITAVVDSTGLSKKDAEKAVKAVFDSIENAVAKGDKVQIVGFGTFETHTRSARQGRNPRTKEPIEIPASRLPVFKAGQGFKNAVAE